MRPGETTVIEPGVLEVQDGRVVAHVTNPVGVVPLPPGDYVVEIGSQSVPVSLAEGQRFQIELR